MSTIEGSGYVGYLEHEWRLHLADPSRGSAMLAALAGHRVRRVLDVGSGAGQEMLPVVRDGTVLGIGLDLAEHAGPTARGLYQRECPRARVDFVRGSMERLPFQDGTFDAVICRLALPYADNRAALSEMSRVLAPRGRLLIKLHHARYYGRQLYRAIRELNPWRAVHAGRVLLSGAVYTFTRVQSAGRVLVREIFQTRAIFAAEAARCGLEVRGELADSNPYTPSLWLEKTDR
jgi:SAM-dependent methyltransferase